MPKESTALKIGVLGIIALLALLTYLDSTTNSSVSFLIDTLSGLLFIAVPYSLWYMLHDPKEYWGTVLISCSTIIVLIGHEISIMM